MLQCLQETNQGQPICFSCRFELCRSLKLTEPTILEHNGRTRKRKSARKEKKKLSTSCANQATEVGERRRAESVDNIDTAVSQPNLNSQVRVTSFSIEAKGKDLLEGTVLEHGSPDHKNIGLVPEQHVKSNDFPAPLATKIYYPQRSNRLRAAIRQLYFQDSSEDTCT
ncbi:hypothetical protein Lalb_Chr20g0118161 [Lupinus albus]|uniref:Uncharacterized protein n=1 Tax=Lupinus albus TaxID=3870 RepID=A0A6A4NVQ1_LUPAL|nr:hypothetical protein Lalb_Chr20g0118161 [Lupinus albus]